MASSSEIRVLFLYGKKCKAKVTSHSSGDEAGIPYKDVLLVNNHEFILIKDPCKANCSVGLPLACHGDKSRSILIGEKLPVILVRYPNDFHFVPPIRLNKKRDPYVMVNLSAGTVAKGGDGSIVISALTSYAEPGPYLLPKSLLRELGPSVCSNLPPGGISSIDFKHRAAAGRTLWVSWKGTENVTDQIILQSFERLGHNCSTEMISDQIAKVVFVHSMSLNIVLSGKSKYDFCLEEGAYRVKLVARYGRIARELDVAIVAELRRENTDMLLRKRKLQLILDLDHTVLHSIPLDVLPEHQQELLIAETNKDGMHIVQTARERSITKIRPYVKEFLSQALEMCEIVVYTMAKREYAEEVVKLLDCRDVIIRERVISREDCTTKDRKSLDLVLAKESVVLIVDDTASVWSKEHQKNLIRVPKYNFFSSTSNEGYGDSLSELKHDEVDQGGRPHLLNTIQLVKDVHSAFFNVDENHLMTSDTRKIMSLRKKNLLKGCNVLFSHIFSRTKKPESQYIWQLSLSLGALCFKNMDPQVTHVITAHPGTDKSKWALDTGKFLVNQQWILDADITLKRQLEKEYPCPTPH